MIWISLFLLSYNIVEIFIAKKSIIEPCLFSPEVNKHYFCYIHKWILPKVPIFYLSVMYVTCLLWENTDLNWTQNSKLKLNILSQSLSNCSSVPIRSALEAVPSAGPGLASQVQYILCFQYSKVSTSKVKSQQTFFTTITSLFYDLTRDSI